MKRPSGVRCQVSVKSIRRRIWSALKANSWQLKADERGFTLLLAALVASITLALGISIFKVAQKEVRLSSVGRDSQYAFYAADTAAECALYWDMRFNYFSTTTPAGFDLETLRCDEECLESTADGHCSDVGGRESSLPYTMSFQFEPANYCANVTVKKTLDEDTNSIRTTIHADGFSTNCEAFSTSPRTLQRSVELHY